MLSLLYTKETSIRFRPRRSGVTHHYFRPSTIYEFLMFSPITVMLVCWDIEKGKPCEIYTGPILVDNMVQYWYKIWCNIVLNNMVQYWYKIWCNIVLNNMVQYCTK